MKSEETPRPILVSADDPSLLFGDEFDQLRDKHGNAFEINRSASNHFVVIDGKPVLYSEDFGKRLWRLAKIPQENMSGCVDLIKSLTQISPQKQVGILEINNQPATECKLAEVFLQNGFISDGEKLVY